MQATTLAQADALKAVAGQADLSGGTASAADVARQVTSAVIGALPAIAGKTAESSVSGATDAALTTALADAAKLPADAIGNIRYTSVNRLSQSSGYSAAGTNQAWAVGGSCACRGDLHWNGTAWVACQLGDRFTASVRDAQGRGTYNFCSGLEKGRSYPGGEYSSYSFDKASGALQISGKVYDTNGCAGIFDVGATANTSWSGTVQLGVDGMSAIVTGTGGTNTIYRIAP